ncbi:helix-turn-helix transcriptional regulator [Aureisphaera galaxeae]|uniref:AraC family transcriptional regulator n=1 Tax=Aureisphaera galaxeae TaxID=1538023 RepID=UPI002350A89E|nr:helix-turn-helix domain-containing protein [Aureisphaera galaxeae]MDC8004802.1 helix-turn-helix transcriptional regulator [Aureisphaera galaxeae]
MDEEKLIQVKFQNKARPDSAFDMLKLEELFRRKSLDHNPENLHKVEFFIILLITEGQGYHTIDFTDYKCEKGTVVTIRKDQIHKFFRSDNVKGHLLLFTDEFLVSYLEKQENQKSMQLFNEFLGVPKIQLSQSDFETVKNIVHRIDEEYFETMDVHSLSIIRSELHILITQLYRIKSQSDQIIADKKYLPEFITFQNLVENHVVRTTRVKDYADMMALSTKTLNTISRNIVNKSAKEFIDEICSKQIKRLLINTSHSIKEISFMMGFEETTNFYKYFKRQLGMTPEQFRASF